MIEAHDGVYTGDGSGWFGMIREDLHTLLASSFPAKPPSGWFADPKLSGPTPLTIDNSGRVFGHIATWKQSHIGMAGSVRAPKSKTNYAFFATGVVECEDGKQVNVGQITLAGGHAPLEASVAETVAHYDNTNSAVMDVSVGEDKHGIWAAGALRPEVTDSQLRAIRASSVSGDWRPINGNLELVAVCSVNVPGFPIPRARVASGQLVAVVAAGTEELVHQSMMDRLGVDLQAAVTASVQAVEDRVQLMENALLNRARDARSAINDAVQKAKTVKSETREMAMTASADELRARVHPAKTWSDGMGIHLSTQECVRESLRGRVRGVQASAWDANPRTIAASAGHAMADGSFPVISAADFEAARASLHHAANREDAARHIRRRGRRLGIDPQIVRSVS